MTEAKKGSLVCVGTGMVMAGDISQISLSHIQSAEQVFMLVPDGFTKKWVESLNPNIINLQQFYAKKGEVKNRRLTYQQMSEAMLEAVRQGKKVVGAFYGHPGVFACVSHMALAKAKEEGFYTKMEAGISAESCLWADLGIDPGTSGHQSFEASQFMLYQHTPDPTCHLLLWQIAIAGEHSLTEFHTSSDRLQVLVELLETWYPLDHQVVIYEAATLPMQSPRIEYLPLRNLPNAELKTISTLMIPPSRKLSVNQEVLAKLGISETDLG